MRPNLIISGSKEVGLGRMVIAGLCVLLLAGGLAALSGCGKEEVKRPGLSAEEAARRRAAAEAARRRAAMIREQATAAKRAFYNNDVYFDFDRSVIRPDGRRVLQQKAAYMKSHPQIRVVIEGHCDERGSRAYNMALGDRRAKAAKRYMVSLGISPTRIKTVSYGKGRPQCREHRESCWSKNRRAHCIDQ